MFSRQFRVALPSARGYIVVLSSLFGIGIALAAPGNLDPGFGEDGLWSLTMAVPRAMHMRSFSKAMASSFWRARSRLINQLRFHRCAAGSRRDTGCRVRC